MDSLLFGRAHDAPLDAGGMRQAERLAERLAAAEGELFIAASPRLRTRQTAQCIAARCGSPVHVASEVDEVDFGRWAGRSFVELHEDLEWRRWNEQRGVASTPAGETFGSLQRRAVAFLQKLAAERPDGVAAVVTHGEIIRAVLMHCLDIPADHYARLEISPASTTTLSFDDGRMVVHAVNERICA